MSLDFQILCSDGSGLVLRFFFASPALTRRDDDVLGVGDGLDRLLHVDLGVGAGDLLGLAAAGGGGAEAAQDDVREGPVHRLRGQRDQ